MHAPHENPPTQDGGEHRAQFLLSRTPYAFGERVRRAKAYMNRPDVAALFDDVKPGDFPAQLGMKLFLMQKKMAFTMCFLFTYVFDRV